MGQKKEHTIDMTQGSIGRLMLRFALPLFAGNLFQQFYNLVDTWTIGNFDSNEGYSAVGTVTPIVNMLIGAFMGFSMGATVVIAQYFGARDEKKTRDAVHTVAAAGLILTGVFTLLGLVLAPLLLRFMNLEPAVYEKAKQYLLIYFAGMCGLTFYNLGSSILRAVGDSRRPFYYLVACTVVNVALDLLFVIVFHMGVAGVAYATILAQAVSAFLVIRALLRTDSWVRLDLHRLKLDPVLLRQVVQVGLPNALQQSIVQFSNIFVQGYINYFGTDITSAWTSYLKLDGMLFLPLMAMSQAVMTFVSQNLGSGQPQRARRGVKTGMLITCSLAAGLAAVILPFARFFVAFLNAEPAVVAWATRFVYILVPLTVSCAVNQVYAGGLRGSGDSMAPMVIMVLSFTLARQIYLYVCANFISNTVIPIVLGYPFGWLVCALGETLYYKKWGLTRRSVIAPAKAEP